MNAQDLKNSILQLAIKGKLVEQREEEGTANELYQQIQEEKERLIEQGKIKKEKKLPMFTEDIPFEIPDTWKWVRINDVAYSIRAGGDKPKVFSPEKTDYYTVPVIANGERNNGIVGYTDKPTVDEESITISGRGTIGFSCIREEPFCPIVRLLVIKFMDNINLNYLQLTLTSLLEVGVGTSIKQLTIPMLKPKLIPLPPLEEQKRIVAKIEGLMPYVDRYGDAYEEVTGLNKEFPLEMEKSILQYAIQGKLVKQKEEEGTAKELYEQIQEEKQRLIDEGAIKKQKKLPDIMEEEIPFDIPDTWKWVRLDDIGQTNIGLTYKPQDISEYGTIVLRSSNIQDGVLDYNDIVKVSSDVPENKMCKIGDILICARNGSKRLVGKAAIIDEEGMSFGAFMAIYRSICNEYLLYVINSPYFRKTMLPDAGTTTINQITQGRLKKLPIPLPPLEEQKRIVAKIKELLNYTKHLVNEE